MSEITIKPKANSGFAFGVQQNTFAVVTLARKVCMYMGT